jgi:hypothetical protein
MKDFFGIELKVGDWVLTPGYKGQDLILLKVDAILKTKILLITENDIRWGGIQKTSKVVIVSEEKAISYLMVKKLEQ